MPSTPANLILEFGKLIHHEAKRAASERHPARIEEAEQRLVSQLIVDNNPHLKSAFVCNVSKPINPFTLRILSLVGYLQLCSNFRISVTDIAIAVADDEPGKILEARQAITQLLYLKRLLLTANSDDQLELGKPMMALLTGGGNALPLTLTAAELQTQWRKNEAAAKRQSKESSAAILTAKQIYEKLSRFVVGQHDLKVALAVAGRQTLLRREAQRQNRRECLPPKANVAIIGASGSGKSYACRILSQILHLPHASIDCSQITASGYVGDDLSSCLYLLSQSAAEMGVDPNAGGVVHLDEIDKLSSSNYESPTTLGVQFEALRLLDGAEVSYPATGMNKWGGTSATMKTSNLLVICSGAFSWIANDLEGRKPQLGFAGDAVLDGGVSGNLRELLATRGGLIPELAYRFHSIIRMAPISPEVIAAIMLGDHGPLGEYRASFQVEGRTLTVDQDAALLVGQWSVATGLMGRGPKAALEQLLRAPLFEGTPKDVVITAGAVRQTLLW